jgi:hypothetical protein
MTIRLASRLASRLALAAALALCAGHAAAQSSVFNCTSGCRAFTSPWALTGVQPASCKLYGIDAAPISAPVVAGTKDNPGAPAGSVACSVPFTLPAARTGSISITATGVSADGQESAASAPFVFTATAGAPAAPALLRVTTTAP